MNKFGGINIGISDRLYSWIENYFDTSRLDFEVTTQIPIELLINIICDFYWNMGYHHIRLDILKLNDEKPYILYKPDFQLEEGNLLEEICVGTLDRKNRQKFDSITFQFEDFKSNKVKILGGFSFGYKLWQFIYVIIALGFSFYIAALPYTTGMTATIVFLILVFLMFVISMYRIRKVEKHPSVEKYKKEFEEHIRMKEKELLPELYE